jgi:hypothetical protein
LHDSIDGQDFIHLFVSCKGNNETIGKGAIEMEINLALMEPLATP